MALGAFSETLLRGASTSLDQIKAWLAGGVGNDSLPSRPKLREIGELTMKPAGDRLDLEGMSSRYRLVWVAGQRGKPGLNADIQNAAESVREIANPDFEILGTNATSALCTFNVEGGLILTTAAVAADQMILAPHLDVDQSGWAQVTWGTDQETRWECDIRTGASIVDAIIWAGLKLTNTSVIATDNDQVYFRYEEGQNSGKWLAVDSIGGTDVSTDTTVVVAINTNYHLVVEIDSSRIARFYINGTLVRTTTALTNTTDLIPYIGIEVQAGGAAGAKVLRVRGQAISRLFA